MAYLRRSMFSLTRPQNLLEKAGDLLDEVA
jgi:hypothetical protein